jgi:hypothetical protein
MGTHRILLRGDTAANWLAAEALNPSNVLLERELVLVGPPGGPYTHKIGDGVTPFSLLPSNPIQAISTAGVIDFTSQSADPAVPLAGEARLFFRSIANRSLPRILGPSGLAVSLQPALFQNRVFIVQPSAASALFSIGGTLTSVGTITHPVASVQYGYMANIASAASGGSTAGTGANVSNFRRSQASEATGGFFYYSRLGFSDSGYNQSGASTGSRFFAGLTSGTLAASVGADLPTGEMIGILRRHVAGGAQDDNFQFYTRTGASFSLVDTTVPFVPEKVYDFGIFSPPDGLVAGWFVRNLTDGIVAQGTHTTNQPSLATFMRPGFQIATINAVARNIRMSMLYTETDVA